MTTQMTATTLITASSGANTIDKARHWIETVRAFALNSTDDKAPNRMPIARDCTLALDDLKAENYASYVSNINYALKGIEDLENGSITP